MKIENFETAKESMVTYQNTKRTLADLDGQITVIITEGGYKVTTIGVWSDSEHPLRHLAIQFIESVKVHYQTKLNKLIKEIEAL